LSADDSSRWQVHRPSTHSIWFALLGGHAAWTLHLLVEYLLVSLSCLPGLGFRLCELNGFAVLLWLLTLATAVLALSATLVGWRGWQQEGSSWRGFLALTRALLSRLFLATILLQGTSLFYLQPCSVQG
jgi:hypothetical protein